MLVKIPLSRLKDNPFQPRFNVDINDADIKGLAESIKENGLQQPITVAIDHEDNNYYIVFGHRRAMAHRYLGLEEINAIVVDIDGKSKESRINALIENVQRENLNPIEIAKAYKDAMDSGFKISELCQKIGKSKSEISKHIKCLSLDERILDYLNANKDAKKDATLFYELASSVKEGDTQWDIFKKYQEGLTDRKSLLKWIKANKEGKSIKRQIDNDMKLLYDHQGFKVRAPFLLGMTTHKKEALEKELKDLLDKYRF